MTYVDGFVAAVRSDKKDEYIEFSKKMGPIMKEFGALSSVDCWGDDVPEGKLTSFPMAVKLEEGEVVCFSWMTWPDKATRDAGMEKMMKDPRFKEENMPMPFDGKRMIYGGFQMIVEF